MITTIYDMEKILQAKGYRKSSESSPSIAVYWGLKDGKEQVIFVTHANKELVFFSKDFTRIRSRAFTNIKDDNVLLIFIGDKRTRKLKGNNCIFINAARNSFKKYGCENFKEVVCDIQATLKYYSFKTSYDNGESVTELSSSHSAAIVYALIAVFIVVYIYTLDNPYAYSMSSQRIAQKEYKYLIYYMFAHGNIRHLTSNSIALITIGRAYIKRNGSFKFALMFLTGGIIAGLSSALGQVNVQTIGASGAIFAILGATLADVITIREYRSSILDVGLYAVLTLVLSSFGRADNYAHLGGFLAGLIISLVLSSNIRVVSNIRQILLLKKMKKARNLAYDRMRTTKSKRYIGRICS